MRPSLFIACVVFAGCLPIPTLASDAPYIARNFQRLPVESQLEVVKVLKQVLEEWEGIIPDTYDSLPMEEARGSWLTHVWAAESTQACLYGGWDSQLKARRCPSPERDPLYVKLFQRAGCKQGEFLCSPALFGEKTCLPASQRVPAQIPYTFQNCRKAFKGKPEDVVRHVTSDPDAFAALKRIALTVEQVCSDDRHPQKRKEVCARMTGKFNQIQMAFQKEFPDATNGPDCYDALDAIKGCAGDANAARARCRYPSLVRAFRKPGSTSEVIISTPNKADLERSGDVEVDDMQLFKKSHARIMTNGDIEDFVGAREAQIRTQEFWNSPVHYREYYAALGNEIRLQMEMQLERNRATPSPQLKQRLAAVINGGCKSVEDPAFVLLRNRACLALALVDSPGCPRTNARPMRGGGLDARPSL